MSVGVCVCGCVGVGVCVGECVCKFWQQLIERWVAVQVGAHQSYETKVAALQLEPCDNFILKGGRKH